ncbi:MAG: hypothetical protein II723_07405 [Oscillospiraceae bacterium]|nr:hypothetical protein [Oscillospiraceae bacterium]
MKRKLISLLISAAMLLMLLPVQAFAASGLLLAADRVTAGLAAGGTVMMPIRAAGNPGYAAGTVDVTWDSTALRLKSVRYDKFLAPENGPAPITDGGSYRLCFGDYQYDAVFQEDGVFFTLEFEIAETAAPGTYPVTLTDLGIYDRDINRVETAVRAGSVTLRGDEALTLTAADKTVLLGTDTEIEIPVTAEQNPGYAAGTADVLWDPAVLTLLEVRYDAALAPAANPAEITADGAYRLCFGDYGAEENYTGTGVFFTLVFSVSADAAPGTTEVQLTAPDVYDRNIQKLDVRLVSSTVTLTGGTETTVTETETAEVTTETTDTETETAEVTTETTAIETETAEVTTETTVIETETDEVTTETTVTETETAEVTTETTVIETETAEVTTETTATETETAEVTTETTVTETETAGVTTETTVTETETAEVTTETTVIETETDEVTTETTVIETETAEVTTETTVIETETAEVTIETTVIETETAEVTTETTAIETETAEVTTETTVIETETAEVTTETTVIETETAEVTTETTATETETAEVTTETTVTETETAEVTTETTVTETETAEVTTETTATETETAEVTTETTVIETETAEVTTETTVIETETAEVTTETTVIETKAADFNGDGAVDVADAILLLRFIAEDPALTDIQIETVLAAGPDLNADSRVTLADARVLLVQLGAAL